MSNIFKSIYSSIYGSRAKKNYSSSLASNEKEEIYCKENGYEYFIAIKDEEVGKRLYELVTHNDILGTEYTYRKADFKLIKYGSNKNCIKWLCIGGLFIFEWYLPLSESQKLKLMQRFIDTMLEQGFVLDNAYFERESHKYISEFLSFFIKSDDKERIYRSQAGMIELIHYKLSDGGNLAEFYGNLVQSKEVVFERNKFPYYLPVAKMCYNYFKTGAIPSKGISEVLTNEHLAPSKEHYSLIALCDKFDSIEVIEKTDEYTIYEGNLKIYQKMSSQFRLFLDEMPYPQNHTLEQIEGIIINLDGDIIGYKFSKNEGQNLKSILDIDFNTQSEVFEYIHCLVNLFDVFDKYDFFYQQQSKSNDFDIEKHLLWDSDFVASYSENKFSFKIVTVKDCFNLKENDENLLTEKVTTIFFKLFSKYITNKYGKLSSKEEFLDKDEIRFLSPLLVKEFINFSLGKSVSYSVATEELSRFLNNSLINDYRGCRYDSRFCYNPFEVFFVFDYEIENEYNIKIEKGVATRLSNGRHLITLKRSKSISKFKESGKLAKKEIEEAIGDYFPIANYQIRVTSPCEIVLSSKRLNADNMYNVVGYIPSGMYSPVERLSTEKLLSLNNKDLLKVLAYYFSCFSSHYIHSENVWVDEDLYFYYIDIYSDDLKIEEVVGGKRGNRAIFIKKLFSHLIALGYNPNAFIDLQRFNCCEWELQNRLLELADSYNSYCDEHGIYYNGHNGKICPACSKQKFLVHQNIEKVLTKVFEDSVAVHYNIDKTYNLKLYKPEYQKLSKIEENVSKIVNMSVVPNAVNLYQDCFIPCKKAIDSNNQFVGLVYKAEKFECTEGETKDVCIDLKDVENLKNLPRVKSLIRLVSQVKAMLARHKFIVDPFTHVFLNASHKKQVQILNIEFLDMEYLIDEDDSSDSHAKALMEDGKTAIKCMKNYIRQVWNEDASIDYLGTRANRASLFTLLNLTLQKPFDSIIQELQKFASQDARYCLVHKMYYAHTVCCPKCVDPEIMGRYIQNENKTDYEDLNLLGEGGESVIYPYGDNMVLKVFKEAEVNIDFKTAVLFKIFEKREVLETSNNKNLKYEYVFPQKILADTTSGRIFGYVMDKVENAYPISILKDKVEVQKLGFSMKDIFEIIITIGEGIENLHESANIYIGDLNGQNILFDKQKNVYFLDFDGMGVDEIAPEFCTDGYIDPVSKKNQNITKKDDWYSFAIQAFYYLTYTHPFNGVYYEVVDGENVLVSELTDKMERRISLLGNHGMKVPSIAVSWDWMSTELKATFLNIFEGELRENIVPYLKEHYKALFENEWKNESLNNILRVNPKFIARELNMFDGRVIRVINSYAAVCEKGNKKYVALLVKEGEQLVQKNLFFSSYDIIRNLLISEDKKFSFSIQPYNNLVYVNKLENGYGIYKESLNNPEELVVGNRTMYWSEKINGNYVISKRIIQSNDTVTKETINLGTQPIKAFNVIHDTKFVLVRQKDQNTDEVYCNSEKFYTIQHDSETDAENCKYRIIYDEITKMWLVVNNFGKCVIIQMDGTSIELDVAESVSNENLASIKFENGNIYLPNQNSLHIVNAKSKVVKKMECHKIMNSKSEIYDVNSKGFSVLTDGIFYEVRRG